ncbi:MAG: lipocalin-like domain-containing protein [Candidatus Acidiferrum sp.]
MVRFILAMVLALVSFQAQASAQSNEKIIGTWKLVSAKITTDTGEVRDSWGPNPVGFLTYTSDGRMSAVLTLSGRKNLSVSDFISAPAAERAEAFASMTAYAGRYTFSGDKVIHHVEAASTPNDVGASMERVIVQLDADRLVLRVAKPYLRGGMMVRQQELVWERVK